MIRSISFSVGRTAPYVLDYNLIPKGVLYYFFKYPYLTERDQTKALVTLNVIKHPKHLSITLLAQQQTDTVLNEVRAHIRRRNHSIRTYGVASFGCDRDQSVIVSSCDSRQRVGLDPEPGEVRAVTFYRQVFEINEPWLTNAASMRQGKRLPEVLTTVQ